MPIDGCEHSFLELAKDVFPSYMSTLREVMTHPIPMADFGGKGVGPETLFVQVEHMSAFPVGSPGSTLPAFRNRSLPCTFPFT